MADEAPQTPATEAPASKNAGAPTTNNPLASKIQAALQKSGGIPRSEDGKFESKKPEKRTAEPTKAPVEAKAEPEETPEATEPKEDDKPKPNTKRAREWADLEKVRAKQAMRDREHERREAAFKQREEEFLRSQAEFTKVQKEFLDLNKLMETNPAEALKRFGKGDVRAIIKSALEQPEITPEQREKLEMQEKLERALAKIEQFEKDRRESEEKSARERENGEREAAMRRDREALHEEYEQLDGMIVAADSLPHLKSLPKPLRLSVAAKAHAKLLESVRKTGLTPSEATILRTLSTIQDELYPAQSPAIAETPARASGAVQSAKPEAKRAPTLRNATVSARASAARPQSIEDKIKALAPQLRR